LLSQCKFFVLDEADGLLKAGYTKQIHSMHSQIPKVTQDGKRLQMIVCSATLHDFEVKKLAVRNFDLLYEYELKFYLLSFSVYIDLFLVIGEVDVFPNMG